MTTDEQSIRALVASWLHASKTGDVDTVLSLIADDAVFLLPGQPVMSKAEFAEKSRAQLRHDAPQIEASSDIQEIAVLGEWAFMRTRLTVAVTPAGGEPITRNGHTLTILRKQHGKWLLARDANLLA
jgi:uncharacterized protein (TIGR02246 family)